MESAVSYGGRIAPLRRAFGARIALILGLIVVLIAGAANENGKTRRRRTGERESERAKN